MTISVDEETARWARIEAARRDTSLSKFVGDVLRRLMVEDQGYEAARRSFQGRSANDLSGGAPYPSREALHER